MNKFQMHSAMTLLKGMSKQTSSGRHAQLGAKIDVWQGRRAPRKMFSFYIHHMSLSVRRCHHSMVVNYSTNAMTPDEHERAQALSDQHALVRNLGHPWQEQPLKRGQAFALDSMDKPNDGGDVELARKNNHLFHEWNKPIIITTICSVLMITNILIKKPESMLWKTASSGEGVLQCRCSHSICCVDRKWICSRQGGVFRTVACERYYIAVQLSLVPATSQFRYGNNFEDHPVRMSLSFFPLPEQMLLMGQEHAR